MLEGGERIERYIGDHWAQIDHGGSSRDTVVRSFTPLRVRDQAGEMVAVDLDLEDRGEVLSPASSPSPVEVADRGGKVTLGGSGLALTPTGTDAAQVDGALSAGRGHFASVATDTDYVVVPMATGVELSWVLRSDRAPETLALELDLPAGTSLREAPVGGPGGLSAPALPARRVELVKDEKVIAAIEPPHAVDADGTEVDVAMAVRDGRLVLDVAHRERDYRFPILVDPVVNDYLSWKEVPGYYDPSVTYNGWFHQQGGCYASACGAVYGYAGSSYHGSGLYAWGQEGHFFTGGRFSQWVWQAPGDAYIYRADFGWAHHDVANSNLYEGIYSVTRSQWENVDISVPPAPGYSIGRYQPYTEPNYLDYDFKTHCQQPCGWGYPGQEAGTPGNLMVFGVQMRSNGTVSQRPMAYLGGATVRLHEFNPPYSGGAPSHTGLPTGWTRFAYIESHLAANDSGLGVKTIDLTSPTGWSKPGQADTCNGARARTTDRPCPGYLSRSFYYNTDDMPEGIVPINAVARDIVGNQATIGSWQVKIDRSGPHFGSISGVAEGELLRDRDYSILAYAADALSGAKEVEITSTGHARRSAATAPPTQTSAVSRSRSTAATRASPRATTPSASMPATRSATDTPPSPPVPSASNGPRR